MVVDIFEFMQFPFDNLLKIMSIKKNRFVFASRPFLAPCAEQKQFVERDDGQPLQRIIHTLEFVLT